MISNIRHIGFKLISMHRRTYFSSRVTSLFVDNLSAYKNKISGDETNSRSRKVIESLLEKYTNLSEGLEEIKKELGKEGQIDKELQGLMKEEKAEMVQQQSDLITNLLDEIHSYELMKDEERIPDSSSILFEISPGVGGKEAMLFANELYLMYSNYFQYKNWDVVDLDIGEEGGYMRHMKATINGNDVWGSMKYEAGVHRVQRIPETESRGRVHTSTVSLACIPVTNDAGVEINGKVT
jgi:peptide chain release factor 1